MSAKNFRLESILFLCLSIICSISYASELKPDFTVLQEVRYTDRIEQKIRFSRPDGSEVRADFILPDLYNGRLDYPGIIYYDPDGGYAIERLEEARYMAAWGAFCIVINGTGNAVINGDTDVKMAIAILQQMPQLRRNRIAFVGFGSGVGVGDQLAGTSSNLCGYLLNSRPADINLMFQQRATAGRQQQRPIRTVQTNSEYNKPYAGQFTKSYNAPVFHQIALPESMTAFDHSALEAIECSAHDHETYTLEDVPSKKATRHRIRWLKQILQ